MKLYLSSFRLGDHPERLTAMLPAAARVGVICNAMDFVKPTTRRAKVDEELARITDLGLRPEELDLRDDDALDRLPSYDGLWVRGGNVFVLRIAMARSGVDAVLPDLIRSERFVYAGYSAGGCVLAPSLRGVEYCDPVDGLDDVIWDGLGVLDHAIVPHLDSPGHPETELLAVVAERYDRSGVPYVGLRDGQALVIDGERRELV
ncbi:Type 1 glutamine amidotransferase-like domain-containing protein [Kribbella sp. NPDC048928]|uniref:Type 1 glutamine amidotransferase-like domain-containing protein n=1 Tax=Kribbella sp. NPDC048928 TaxID=3364111 RepID=UPI00370FACAC